MRLQIAEKLNKIESDIFITDYAKDIANLCSNKPKEYRLLYDAQLDAYMICPAWDYIHIDMINKAFRQGWYESQKYFCGSFVYPYNRGMGTDYFEQATSLIELDEYDDGEFDMSLLGKKVKHDEGFIYPWVYCLGFLPKGSNSGNDLTKDGYDRQYNYSFGTLYTREFELNELPELKRAFDVMN